MTTSKELWSAYIRIFFVELAYWVVSIGMVFVNEYVLSSDLLTDDLTVFVTLFQILFSLSILVSLNYITKRFFINNDNQTSSTTTVKNSSTHYYLNYNDNSKKTIESVKLIDEDQNNDIGNLGSDQTTHQRGRRQSNSDDLVTLLYVNIPGRINLDTCKLVLPLSVFYIGMLLLNNFCLKNVGVAFYFVSRSLTTVFNVIFTYFLMNESVSRGALSCCASIILGFILGIDQESVIGSLSVKGVIYGIASSLFTSLFSICTKKTLHKLNKNIWLLVLYNNINAVVLCTPFLILHGDIQALISDKVISPTFWFLLSISGIMSFFISIVTNASIKYTSPLTHNISGTAKACLQTVIAVIYYHDHKSFLWWLSNLTILIASAFYSRIKQVEMGQKMQALNETKLSEEISASQIETAKLDPKTKNEHQNSSSSSVSSYEMQADSDCCSIKFESASD